MKYLFIILIFLTSCQTARINKAYNRVALDPMPSERNKNILSGVCSKNFPQLPMQVIPGKTKWTHDTLNITDTLYSVSHDTVTKTIVKNQIIHQTETKTDTIIKTDPYQFANCQSENNELKIKNGVLAENFENANKGVSKLKRQKIYGWIAFAILALFNLGMIYLRSLKPRI